MKRALVSVSDKRGVAALCRVLAERGVEILSTGGTARALTADGIPVTQVSDHTGSPEIMGGRVKTLHPKIHGGILARRGVDEDVMTANDIGAIDLVVVNLYPFRECIAQPDCTLEAAIENIDIGGPTMLRAAAKNHRDVAVLVDPDDYDLVVAQLKKNDGIDAATKFKLATKAFEHSADYEAAIANYLGGLSGEGDGDDDEKEFPQTLRLTLAKKQTMRYGENPHQAAAFYSASGQNTGIAAAKQLQGKPLSFNNIADADAAWQCVSQFTEPACVIVKHANPCGVALGKTQQAAYDRAFATDPESAFGGVIAFNQPLTFEPAAAITAKQFAEVIIAPAVSAEARAALAAKADIRVLECGGEVTVHNVKRGDKRFDYRTVTGGMLVQHADLDLLSKTEVVTKRAPSKDEMRDLLFAWQVAKFVKSNAIVYAGACATVGVGAGQMSRVNSARIAAIKAQHANLQVRGAVMASDAFFPFRDGLDNAAEAGIRAVIQPGGSKRDAEVIAAADEHQMAMVFTGMRHFRH